MLVHPDAPTRELGVRQLQAAARCARLLGAHNTYIRPGSLSPHGPWRPYPGNNHLTELAEALTKLAALERPGNLAQPASGADTDKRAGDEVPDRLADGQEDHQ